MKLNEKIEQNHLSNFDSNKSYFDLSKIVESILSDSNCIRNIGMAWPLFFYICSRANSKGTLTTTYRNVSKQLGINVATLKYWRKLLNQKLIVSYSGGDCVHFNLLKPFSEFIINPKEELNNHNRVSFQEAVDSMPFQLQKRIIELVSRDPNLLHPERN